MARVQVAIKEGLSSTKFGLEQPTPFDYEWPWPGVKVPGHLQTKDGIIVSSTRTGRFKAMGSGFNLPPGCYESDLPGWHDVERDVDFECTKEECGHTWTETDVTVDSRGDHDVEADCPECKTHIVAYYPSVERD